MDINKFISSGILEQYVLGSLSETEMKEVEQMASSYPEVRTELETIEKTLISYSSLYRKNPSPGLRQKVLDKINEYGEFRTDIIPVPQIRKDAASFRYLMAAVLTFLVLNIIVSVYMYYKWQGTEIQLASIIEDNKNMRSEYEKVKLMLDKKSNDMHMIMNRKNRVVDLKGMEASPSSSATVYWNPNSKKVMLNVENLPMPPNDMQYQLWALKDGKPIDAGVFDMGDDPMHMMNTPIENADAFAVTLEKKGGSKEPTMSQIYLAGKI